MMNGREDNLKDNGLTGFEIWRKINKWVGDGDLVMLPTKNSCQDMKQND